MTLKILIRLMRHRTARIIHRSNGATIDVVIVRQNSVYSKLQAVISVCDDHRETLFLFGTLSYLTLWVLYNYPLAVANVASDVLLLVGIFLTVNSVVRHHRYAAVHTLAATCVTCIWLWSSGWFDWTRSCVENLLIAKEAIRMRMEIQFHENGSATVESTRGINRSFFVGNASLFAKFQLPID
jgi:hypothetical protein